MIFLMICTYQAQQLTQKWKVASIVIKPNQIAMFVGILAGLAARYRYSSGSLEELRRGQAFMFKVFLVPPILFEA